MTVYLLAVGAAVLAFAAGYLRGTRQHVAEEAQATWVHDLVTAEPAEEMPEFSVDEDTMRRLLALLNSPLTVELDDTDYWAPIAASMGPLPVEPELVSV